MLNQMNQDITCQEIRRAKKCNCKCEIFLDGDCEYPQNRSVQSIKKEYPNNYNEIFEKYSCFEKYIEN